MLEILLIALLIPRSDGRFTLRSMVTHHLVLMADAQTMQKSGVFHCRDPSQIKTASDHGERTRCDFTFVGDMGPPIKPVVDRNSKEKAFPGTIGSIYVQEDEHIVAFRNGDGPRIKQSIGSARALESYGGGHRAGERSISVNLTVKDKGKVKV